MGWIKRPKRGAIDLGTSHIDTITAPDTYVQPFASRATKAQGYPFEGQAGVHEVLPWRSDGGIIARYTPQNGVVVTRYWLTGTWSPWRDATGKAVT